jgi:hypothetical protein
MRLIGGRHPGFGRLDLKNRPPFRSVWCGCVGRPIKNLQEFLKNRKSLPTFILVFEVVARF